MKQVVVSVLMLLLCSLFLAGCGGTNEQLEVAKKFWSALEKRDLETARLYATRATAQSLTMDEDQQDQQIGIAFGGVTKDGEKRMVATTISTTNNGTDMTIPMQTVLVKEAGDWKVDVHQTMMSMFGGAMGEMMEGLTESMKDGMEEMGKAMTEQMESTMQNMKQASGD